MASISGSSSDSGVDERPSFMERKRTTHSSNVAERPAKRRRQHGHEQSTCSRDDATPPQASAVALGIMQKMGFTVGKGLGKQQQGRIEPVQASMQKGRRGLGHKNKQLLDAMRKWDPSAEIVLVEEEISWLANKHSTTIPQQAMLDWMHFGPRKETIHDEITFCDPPIVRDVVISKSIFDNLDGHEMRRARTRSNPFEKIGSVFFQNRAAAKMANIDRACDFIFTQPDLPSGEILHFADVCAGPGGFSEYVLWRRKWHAKGYGFTLRSDNDFKLDNFYAGGPETFHPFYGPKEDGNVYDPKNQEAFRDLIMEHTQGKGVHFMMADGGFSVEGRENLQEILSKQLYLCQCLVGLMIVRPGGHFVTKVFDLFTPFSVGLVYLMYRCFEKISIFKPNTSRPANSERYLICENKLGNVDPIIEYMKQINECLIANNPQLDVLQLVPLHVLQSDQKFFDYIYQSNCSIGQRQITALLKIAAYCEDPSLFEHRQPQMRRDCLQYWNIPDRTRFTPRNVQPEEKIQTLVDSMSFASLKKPATNLTTASLPHTILNPPCDWYGVLCNSPPEPSGNASSITLYLGMGRTKVFKKVKNTWERVTNIELPADTLVYAETVEELRGQHRTSRKTHALHIIDAFFLGGEDVSRCPLLERQRLIHKFCQALWKPGYQNTCPVRAKELHAIDNDLMSKFILYPCTLKNGKQTSVSYINESRYPRTLGQSEDPVYFIPNTVVFLKSPKAPWARHLSKSSGCHYYFNRHTNKALYGRDVPASAFADFAYTFSNRIEWPWLHDNSITLGSLVEAIEQKCPRRHS